MVAPRKMALAEESAEVEVLFANMEKLKSLTKKIQGSLNRLETSGKSVEDAIRPIYGNTQRLQTTNNNIDKVVEAIDRIRQPLDQRSREERVINAGPKKVGLADFIASLDRTTQALGELKQSNLRSNQQAIAELNSLLKRGTKQLEDVFREILREDARMVEPLHYITKQLPFPAIPEDKVSQLRTINSHVAASVAQISQTDLRDTPTAKIHAEVRGEYMTNTLRNLSAACVSTAKKTTADALYRQGTNGIGTYCAGIEGIITAEYNNICHIFAREDWARVYTATCQTTLNEFAKTLRELNTHVKNNLLTDCFLAYEIIDVVSNLSLRLEKHTGELKRAVADALKPIRETAKSSLRTLLEDVRNKVQSLVAVPIDGSATNTTAEMMARLQQMTNYLAPLASVLISLGDGGWSNGPTAASTSSHMSFDVGADGRQLFANYAIEMIDTHLKELDAKARVLHKSKSLQGVFIANNVAIIDRMIRSSELAGLMGSAQKLVEGWRKKGTQAYLDAWKEPSAYLLDVQYTNRGGRPPSGGAHSVDSASVIKNLSSKDRDSLKEKWKNFNVAFDELIAKHKGYGMEKEVKTQLAREVQTMIEPLYGRFWDRYHEIDKGKGKYVKYDKAQLGTTLSSLA
ncbi:Cullin repeat-like-containing domain protein [Phyllosticta citrichinensis]|uniref:Exocyst complex protein EXO70 n=1 Tax=Phyllosticta citrichinensis TaxID=1130410 RepID=A0ABR1XLG1_9PEZI